MSDKDGRSRADAETGDVVLVSIGNFGGARPVDPEPPRPSCLLKLSFDSEMRTWIDVGCSENPLVAGLGICCDDHYVYHVSLAKAESRSILSVLERPDLNVVHVQTLAEVSDVHSIQRVEGELCVVSTGTDEIIAYELDGVVAQKARVVWTPTGSGSDTHHINSLAVVGNELFCSAFGPPEGASWQTARDGYIHNVTSDTRVIEHLIHPHSVASHGEQLYYCQSPDGTVNSIDGVVGFFAGYSRGLTFGTEGSMYVGTSFSRRVEQTSSDSMEFHNLGFSGTLTGQCAVVRVPPSGARLELSLSSYGHEIYDIVVL